MHLLSRIGAATAVIRVSASASAIATASATAHTQFCFRPPQQPVNNNNQQLPSFFSTTAPPLQKPKSFVLPPRPTLPDHEIKHTYLKGSGPGGQKINKTSSAVQLTHLPTGLVVKSQATRSRSQNHTIARRILAEKIELLTKGEESRVAKRIERDRRKKASAGKKTRRKYRKLKEEEEEEGEEIAANAVVLLGGDDGEGRIQNPGEGQQKSKAERDGYESEEDVDETDGPVVRIDCVDSTEEGVDHNADSTTPAAPIGTDEQKQKQQQQ